MVDPIYLNDPAILPWPKPLPPGNVSMLDRYNGSTNLLISFGVGNILLRTEEYLVSAVASEYVAEVAKVPPDAEFKYAIESEEDKSQPEQGVLFNGSISIFRKGVIPGTKINGEDLVRTGRIWTFVPGRLTMHPGEELEMLVLNKPREEERIEAILLGYQIQEDTQKQRRFRIEIGNEVRAQRSGHGFR